MSITVRLVQQKVTRETRLGPTSVDVPQMQIFATLDSNAEVMVGYVGTQPDAPINLIFPDLPSNLVDEIEKQVRSLRQESLSKSEIATPPTSDQLAELDPVPFEDALPEEDELEA